MLRDFAQASAVLLGALYDGIAGSAREWLVGWLRERVPASLGAPLASLPRMQEALGGIDGLLLQNRLLLDAACCGQLPASDSGLLKVAVIDNALAVVERAPGTERPRPQPAQSAGGTTATCFADGSTATRLERGGEGGAESLKRTSHDSRPWPCRRPHRRNG